MPDPPLPVGVPLGVPLELPPAPTPLGEPPVPPPPVLVAPPAPEGVVVVRMANGAFRPSNLQIQLEETSIVKWVNEDDREYLLAGRDGEFETTLVPGGEFEFDFATLAPGIYRYFAEVGFQRIPGSVDTRPTQ